MIFVLIIPRLLKKRLVPWLLKGDDIKAINDEGELVTIKKINFKKEKNMSTRFLRFISFYLLFSFLISSGIQA